MPLIISFGFWKSNLRRDGAICETVSQLIRQSVHLLVTDYSKLLKFLQLRIQKELRGVTQGIAFHFSNSRERERERETTVEGKFRLVAKTKD